MERSASSTSDTKGMRQLKATGTMWQVSTRLYDPEFRSQHFPESVAEHNKEAWDLLAQSQVAVSRAFGTM